MLKTRTGSGWSLGPARQGMREQLDGLQSFEPDERARAGQVLVATDLDRNADALLDHVANEFDDRVVTAIARAVVATPTQPKESRRVARIREWAESELDRLALEEAFMGREPEPVDVGALVPIAAPEPLPARLRYISWHAPRDDADAADAPAPSTWGWRATRSA